MLEGDEEVGESCHWLGLLKDLTPRAVAYEVLTSHKIPPLYDCPAFIA